MVNNLCNAHVFPKGYTFEEINKDHPNDNKQRLSIYIELTISREPAATECSWQRLKGRQSRRRACGGYEKASGVLRVEAGTGLPRRRASYVIG